MKRKLTLFLALLLAMTVCAGAVVSRPSPSTYAVDDAGVLTESDLRTINARGARTAQETGADVILVTLDYPGTYDIDEYCDAIFDEWDIADGLVLVMTIGNEDYYAMPSVGLNRYLTTNDIAIILNDYLEPDFAAENYSAGAAKVYDAFCTEIISLYNENIRPTTTPVAPTEPAPIEEPPAKRLSLAERIAGFFGSLVKGILIIGLIIVLLIVLVIAVIARPFRRTTYTTTSRSWGHRPPPPPPPHGHRPPPPPPGPGPRPGAPRPGTWGSRERTTSRPPTTRSSRPSGFGGGGSSGSGAGRSSSSRSSSSGSGRSSSSRSSSSSSRGSGFGGGGSRGGGAGRGGGRR